VSLRPISVAATVMTGKKLQQGQPGVPNGRTEGGRCNKGNHRHVSVSLKASGQSALAGKMRATAYDFQSSPSFSS